MTNKKLSIAIPSYDRPEMLKLNLLEMLPEIKEFSIQIFVSDDSNSNETQIMIDEMRIEYGNICYSRNTPGLGHDENIFRSLSLPKTDYVWLIGDSILIKQGGIKKVLEIIENDQPEIIAVNAKNRDLDAVEQHYKDCNLVFDTFAWHLTATGATIYSQNTIACAKSLIKDECKNFPHIAIIFQHLSEVCSFYWLNHKWISLNNKKTSYWIDNMFKIFLDDWSTVVRSLPKCYDQSSKERVILVHSQKARIFNLRSLLIARANGLFDSGVLQKNKHLLPSHSGLRFSTLLVISLAPKGVLSFFYKIKKHFG